MHGRITHAKNYIYSPHTDGGGDGGKFRPPRSSSISLPLPLAPPPGNLIIKVISLISAIAKASGLIPSSGSLLKPFRRYNSYPSTDDSR